MHSGCGAGEATREKALNGEVEKRGKTRPRFETVNEQGEDVGSNSDVFFVLSDDIHTRKQSHTDRVSYRGDIVRDNSQ